MAVRVLWVVKGLGPGGAERLLVAAARAHDPNAVQVECAYVLPYKDHLTSALEAARVRCTCLSRRDSDPRWPAELARLIRDGDFDVVHVHSPVPGSVARAVVRTLPRASRPALMSTEHNSWARHRPVTRFLNAATSRWDQFTYAVSAETRASVTGPAARRAQVLTHGIDVDAVAAQRVARDAVRAELGLAEDEVVIGTVANMTPQKDYPTLLQATWLLTDAGARVRVVAVGQGPLEQETRAQASQMGLDGVVTLTGYRDDAVRVLAACDVFTLSSAWEGLPVALMEALALGLPVVATRVGGVAETMRDGEDALLVPASDPAALADAWSRVVVDDGLRARLGAAAWARASEFDMKRTVATTERTYLRLARTKPQHEAPEPTHWSSPRSAPRSSAVIRLARDADRPAILELLQRSLGSPDARYAELFAWKHDANAFGPSPMWVAEVDERIVAFRTFLRWEFVRGGEVVRAVRAVDTATDPAYQGQGLFRALTMHAVDRMREDGVAFVFNTPNDQSRPGYLRMGWRDVGRIHSAFRVANGTAIQRLARARVPAERWSQPLPAGEPVESWLARADRDRYGSATGHVRQLRTRVTDDYLRWRYGLSQLHYRAFDDGVAALIARSRRRGDATELSVVQGFGTPDAVDKLAGRALRESGADYALRIGQPTLSTGFVPLPGGGPRLTWRALVEAGMPPLPNWSLSLGDVELF